MFRTLASFALTLTLALSATAIVHAGQPNFNPAIYADGEAWGTKGVTTLPEPNAHNLQSFDKLFVFTNSTNPDQLPVAEAAPRNPAYNGGRWFTHTVTWNMMNGTLVTSYADLMAHANAGHLTIMAGSPPGGPPAYFECPLLPVK
jgi:hypothetical protein